MKRLVKYPVARQSPFLILLLWVAVFYVSGLAMAAGNAEPSHKQPGDYSQAIFAGGCFWCMEKDFEKLKGVIRVESGYAGGEEAHPGYKQVSSGKTGHTESVLVVYDARVISYAELLQVFWYAIDPFVANRQFCDSGKQYRTAIFYSGDEQKRLVEASLVALRRTHNIDKDIYTQILPATRFWPAESYHQDYYLKNPLKYRFYRYRCGRDQRLQEIWGDKAGWHP